MKNIVVVILLLLVVSKSVYGFDDEITHRQLTAKAAKAAEASYLSNYLKSNLGLQEGVSTLIKDNKTVSWWLSEGSYLEDHPMCRASNHFHNPLKPWDKAGLGIDQISTLSMAIDAYCIANYPQYTKKYSNVKWATGPFSLDPDGVTGATNNDMNWQWARTFYYEALTRSSKTERESFLTSSFTALGQVMHLLEDMAVPAHVRRVT